jgi:hypothetical protein
MTLNDAILDTLAELADRTTSEGDEKAVWGLEAVIMAYCLDTEMDAEDVRQIILDRRRKRIEKEHEALLSLDQNNSVEKLSNNTRRSLLLVDNKKCNKPPNHDLGLRDLGRTR